MCKTCWVLYRKGSSLPKNDIFLKLLACRPTVYFGDGSVGWLAACRATTVTWQACRYWPQREAACDLIILVIVIVTRMTMLFMLLMAALLPNVDGYVFVKVVNDVAGIVIEEDTGDAG